MSTIVVVIATLMAVLGLVVAWVSDSATAMWFCGAVVLVNLANLIYTIWSTV